MEFGTQRARFLFFPSYSPLQKSRLSHKNRRSPIRYGFLAGIKAIRFSVKTATVNVYSCPTCTERLQAGTNGKVNAKYGCYYIHFSVSNFPPGELTFWEGGGGGGRGRRKAYFRIRDILD